MVISMAIEKFDKKFRGKRVAVVGVGISNTPIINMLVSHGAFVTARDKNSVEFEKAGVTVITGDGYLDNLDEDIIIKTPGMRFDTKELYLASKNGSLVTTEMELFFELCPSKNIIGVTGSDGKTTTSTIIALLLEKAGKKVWLGGNIGKPLLPEIEKIGEEDFIVTELSSFQLQTMKKSPKIAVVTNISPNHLDLHRSYEEYISAKKNIYLHQKKTDTLILNAENTITNSFKFDAKAEIYDFTSKSKTPKGIFLENNCLYFADKDKIEKMLEVKDIAVPGIHNVENYMAAILAVFDYVSVTDIKSVAKEFKGVNHRMSLIRELDGVKYFNSSIDSSPSRTTATLSVFEKNVILICGGKNKNLDFGMLGKPILEKVKTLILTGQIADKIHNALLEECEKQGVTNPVKVIFADRYEEIVKIARSSAVSGDVVLLSPAGTSFDKFKNFEERGDYFSRLVNELK